MLPVLYGTSYLQSKDAHFLFSYVNLLITTRAHWRTHLCVFSLTSVALIIFGSFENFARLFELSMIISGKNK